MMKDGKRGNRSIIKSIRPAIGIPLRLAGKYWMNEAGTILYYLSIDDRMVVKINLQTGIRSVVTL